MILEQLSQFRHKKYTEIKGNLTQPWPTAAFSTGGGGILALGDTLAGAPPDRLQKGGGVLLRTDQGLSHWRGITQGYTRFIRAFIPRERLFAAREASQGSGICHNDAQGGRGGGFCYARIRGGVSY